MKMILYGMLRVEKLIKPTEMEAYCTERIWIDNRVDYRLAPGQWETSLQSNTVSHWLGANLESAL